MQGQNRGKKGVWMQLQEELCVQNRGKNDVLWRADRSRGGGPDADNSGRHADDPNAVPGWGGFVCGQAPDCRDQLAAL